LDVTRQAHRYDVVQRRQFPLTLIPFKSLVSTDLVAHVIDVSKQGVGIESDHPLQPGFIWFKDRINGFKGGLLVWAKAAGERYRAGVKFVPLSHSKEQLVQDRMTSTQPSQPLHNPEVIISTILEAMTEDRKDEQPEPDRPETHDVQTLRADRETPTEEDLIAQLRSLLSSL
jgi:hypothetical protein